eukprot:7591_1
MRLIFSRRIFILMFLGALYSWIYHNKQQAQEQYDIDDHYIAGNGWSSYTTSPSATHISNDITPTTTYTIGLPAMAPVVTKKKMETQRCDIQGITESCFSAA